MTTGIQLAARQAIATPLPLSWLGRPDAPTIPNDQVGIMVLTATEISNLEAQIAYDQSVWSYSKIGTGNRLGRYQIRTTTLEKYGLLATGSNTQFGTNCINYQTCWQEVVQRKNTTSYATYLYNVRNLSEFLASSTVQEQLVDQIIYDLYNNLSANGAITADDPADIVAGMIYVGWTLGVGSAPTYGSTSGTGAYAWRYYGIDSAGQGVSAFNSGRYAIVVLSQ